MKSTAQPALDPKLPTGSEQQPPLKTGLTIVSRSTQTRASNAARAALVVANLTPTGYRVGVFMADHARYAQASDVRRNVQPDEIFTYWPQAKIAAEMGCSERQVRRGMRSLREAGVIDVRRRVRPCEASYVWVLPVRSGVRSGVLSGVRSHTEPRTEPQKNHVGSSRAREVCKICGNNWPAEYGTTCYQCPQPTASKRRDEELEQRNEEAGNELERQIREEETPKVCTCGDAYRNSYRSKCVDCDGNPNAAQRDALREKHGGGAAHDGGVTHERGADNPSVPQTETRPAPETRGESSEDSVLPEHAIPPDGGEPGPAERRFKAELAKWTVGKRTPLQHRSERRRLARALRKEQADLAIGVDA